MLRCVMALGRRGEVHVGGNGSANDQVHLRRVDAALLQQFLHLARGETSVAAGRERLVLATTISPLSCRINDNMPSAFSRVMSSSATY